MRRRISVLRVLGLIGIILGSGGVAHAAGEATSEGRGVAVPEATAGANGNRLPMAAPADVPAAPNGFVPASPADELREEAFRPFPGMEQLPVQQQAPVQDDSAASISVTVSGKIGS